MRNRLIFILLALACTASSAAAATTRPASRPGTSPSTRSSALEGIDSSVDLGAGADGSPELGLYQDIPVVVAASKHAETIHQAPASVSVITQDDILLFNYRSLADALRNQRSFYLDTDGLNWFAGTRGFLRAGEWNSRLLVLVDDRPTNEIIFGQTHLDPDFVIPMEAVKQIEVIRGPGSALYGSDAVFGVVNAVSKDGADVNGAEVKMEGGTQDTLHGNALVGFTSGGWDVLGDFSGFTTDGNKDVHYDGVTDPAHNFGNIDNSDKEAAYDGFFKAKKGEFTAEVDFAARQQDNVAATYLTSFFDPGTMYEQRINTTMRIDHPIDDDQSIHAMVYYGHYGYAQDYGVAAAPPAPAYGYTTTAYDDWVGEDVHYDWQATKRFNLIVGADGTQALYARQHDFDSLQGDVLNITSSYNSYAGFVEGEYKLFDSLSLTAGARYDQIERLGGSFSPRFAAIYTPSEADTFKALYGRTFREPNLYELFYNSPGSNTPNPNLKAEVVDTYEVVYERQFKNGFTTSLNGFLWNMNNAMDDEQLPDGSVQTENEGSTNAKGVEAEIDKRWDTGASFRAYATYTWAQHEGELPPLSPKWIVGTSLAIPLFKDNYLSIEPQFVGPMQNDLGQFTEPTYITNIVFTSEHLFKNWTLQVGVYNLFANSARFPRDGIFEQAQSTLSYPPTQFLASLTCKF